MPTLNPTNRPTLRPSGKPTLAPTNPPSQRPSRKPTLRPTNKPTPAPSRRPTLRPTRSPTFAPTASPVLELSTIRINCGSSNTYVDPVSKNVWSNDTFFNNGHTYAVSSNVEILNTTIDTIFHTERYFNANSNNGYIIPVNPGSYIVRLYFAEIYVTKANVRVFDVYLQNTLIKSNFDIFSETGGMYRAMIVSSNVVIHSSTTDPTVQIMFKKTKENPKISGIEIIPNP
jgi:Malectin domain